MTSATKPFSNGGALGGLASLKNAKFLGTDAAIPGIGLGPALSGSLIGGMGALAGGIRSNNPEVTSTSSGSEDDTFSPKKRRWSKPLEEEVL